MPRDYYDILGLKKPAQAESYWATTSTNNHFDRLF